MDGSSESEFEEEETLLLYALYRRCVLLGNY